MANLKEQCPDSVRGIMAVSDAVEIRMDGECDDTKNISVQVSMDDEEDQDSQLVVIRYLQFCQTLRFEPGYFVLKM